MKRNNIFAKLILAVLALAIILSSCSLAGSLEELRPRRYTPSYMFPLTVYNLEELEEFLPNAIGGFDENNPGLVFIKFDLGTMTDSSSNWQKMLKIIDESGKYIELNLAECEMTGTTFNLVPSVKLGKDKIVSIELPSSATNIPPANSNPQYNYNSAFRYFTNLKDVKGSNINEIGSYAFFNIKSLSSIHFPVKKIGDNAFGGCIDLGYIEGLDLPDVTNIGAFAFESSGIYSINLPVVKNIGKQAFDNCTRLHRITINHEVNMEWGNPFTGCTSLNEFNLVLGGDGEKIKVLSTSNGLYKGEITEAELICFPAGDGVVDFYSFPEIIKKIGTGAFMGNNKITKFSSDSVIEVGDYAFSNCTSLTEVDFLSVETIGDFAFQFTGDQELTIYMDTTPPDLGLSMFDGVDVVKNVTVKVPSGHKSAYSDEWQKGFKGAGWNGSSMVDESLVNTKITLTIDIY